MTIIFDFVFVNNDLYNEKVIIFERDGALYYLKDINDRYEDVVSMPYYIRSDYFKYRSKLLTMKIFDGLISKLMISPTGKLREVTEDQSEKIMQIKRDLKLKDLL